MPSSCGREEPDELSESWHLSNTSRMLAVGGLCRRGRSSLLVKDLGDVCAEFKSLRKNVLSSMILTGLAEH